MSKVLVWRGGQGIGDALFMTPVFRLLAEQGDQVYVAGRGPTPELYENNPHVAGVVETPTEWASQEEYDAWQDKTFAEYDRVVPLAWTCEKKYLHRTDGYFGNIPTLEQRRRAAKGQNYYDENLRAAKLQERPVIPELYPNELEQESLDRLLAEKQKIGFKMVLWSPMGSTMNKMLTPIGFWIKAISEMYPAARHYLTGNVHAEIPSIPRDNPNIFHVGGRWSLRMSLLMTSIADLVIGPESALVNAAACFSTPKIIFYSHSAPDNLGRYYVNHIPIVPKCECSPCYLIPINFRNLWNVEKRALALGFEKECSHRSPLYYHRVLGYKCVMSLDREEIIEKALDVLHHGPPIARAVDSMAAG